MPKILELKEIDSALWVRLGSPGDFPSGVALWTPDEQRHARNEALEDAARLADDAPEIAEAIRESKHIRKRDANAAQ